MSRVDVTATRSASYQSWNTDLIRPKDRFEYYRDGICRAFNSLSPEIPPQGSFFAEIDILQTADGLMNRCRTAPHLVRRTKEDLSSIRDEHFNLVLITSGAAEKVGDDARSYSTGDVYLEFANKTFTLDCALDSAASMLSVRLSKKALCDHLGSGWHENYIKINRSACSEALFNGLVAVKKRFSAGDHGEMDALHSALKFLVIAYILGDDEKDEKSFEGLSGPKGVLLLTKDLVERLIGDPCLSPALVAQRIGVSVRYIHKVFETEGTSFGHYVMEERLDRIRRDLLNPTLFDLPVGSVARRWGLPDPTSFHRNFKARYGCTPGQLRGSVRR